VSIGLVRGSELRQVSVGLVLESELLGSELKQVSVGLVPG
jgi:hypothetical protein